MGIDLRRPHIRLWHLFALVTLVAVLVWLWPRVGFEIERKPGNGSRAALVWQGRKTVELWNTLPIEQQLRLERIQRQRQRAAETEERWRRLRRKRPEIEALRRQMFPDPNP